MELKGEISRHLYISSSALKLTLQLQACVQATCIRVMQGIMWIRTVLVIQGRQKHFSFGQAKYNGGVIPLRWTGKWTGMVEWNMEWTMEFTFVIAIPNSTV